MSHFIRFIKFYCIVHIFHIFFILANSHSTALSMLFSGFIGGATFITKKGFKGSKIDR